jgi:hypothetical protein
MRYATRLIAVTSLIAPAVLCAGVAARAQTLNLNGTADLDLVLPSAQRSFQQGGLGKLEFGGGGQTPMASGQALADVRVGLAPSFGTFVTLRLTPDEHVPFDVLEAYARYQPVSSRDWVWSLKGGAFFPPISLENEGIGWTSPWTVTSSAINSWIGQELRTIGTESSLEWRHEGGSIGVVAALFWANDPAGTLLAERGWTFDSRPSGIFGEPRRPDLFATQVLGRVPPIREEPFKEVDHRPGWYAGASLRRDGIGRLAALYYDNRADPGMFIGNDFGWRTKFASLAGELDIGDVVLLSQAMFGNTTIEPFEDGYFKTNFQAAYLLAGYYFDEFRIAARLDVFATQQHNTVGGPAPGEHGHALTLAGTWTPRPWLRLTAEMLRVDSDRGQRAFAGSPSRVIELQGQFVTRVSF